MQIFRQGQRLAVRRRLQRHRHPALQPAGRRRLVGAVHRRAGARRLRAAPKHVGI